MAVAGDVPQKVDTPEMRIDLLEVALLITQRYGFSLRSDDPENRRIFASLRNLAAHIAAHRTK